MLITRMAIWTCIFYFLISVVLQVLAMLAFWTLRISYTLSFTVWLLFFGFIWLTSFCLAWRIVLSPFQPRFPG